MPTRPSTFRLNKNQKEKQSHRPCEQWRGSAKDRGYDGQWVKLRNAFIAENPLCKHCDERGETMLATEVDHIRPFRGKDDPLRLAPSNLQSLCHSCHVVKTKRDRQ